MRREKFNKDFMIPYDMNHWQNKGNKTYCGHPDYIKNKEPNSIFKEALGFECFEKGRSSVKAVFISHATKNRYEMFLSDIEELMRRGADLHDLEGEFCFVKKGANYGLVMLED